MQASGSNLDSLIKKSRAQKEEQNMVSITFKNQEQVHITLSELSVCYVRAANAAGTSAEAEDDVVGGFGKQSCGDRKTAEQTGG